LTITVAAIDSPKEVRLNGGGGGEETVDTGPAVGAEVAAGVGEVVGAEVTADADPFKKNGAIALPSLPLILKVTV